MNQPFIVGLGGTAQPGSSVERALHIALAAAERAGARTLCFDGAHLTRLPHYLLDGALDTSEARSLLDAIRQADGLIIASPGYHGSISGLVKNAIDYLEETAREPRAYLDGLPIGLIVTAHGWQATGSTLAALRSIVHSLRGWPTPYGAAINSAGGLFTEDGAIKDKAIAAQLETVGQQVLHFVKLAEQGLRTHETSPI